MVFKAQVSWYNPDGKTDNIGVYMCADSYVNAMEKLVSYYGEEEMERISIEPFSPDDLLEFDMDNQDDKEIYFGIEEKAEDICW